jgi:predicted RNase H-like HicB family nuclease
MSTGSSANHDPPTGTTITLVRGDEWWVATDEETGVASQGKSRKAALENLDEAVALYQGEIGREPTDDELREIGIDPEDNVPGRGDLPEILK